MKILYAWLCLCLIGIIPLAAQNTAPIVSRTIPNQSNFQGSVTFDLSTYFRDKETPSGSLIYAITSGTPNYVTVNITGTELLIEATYAGFDQVSDNITVQATDPSNASISQTFNVEFNSLLGYPGMYAHAEIANIEAVSMGASTTIDLTQYFYGDDQQPFNAPEGSTYFTVASTNPSYFTASISTATLTIEYPITGTGGEEVVTVSGDPTGFGTDLTNISFFVKVTPAIVWDGSAWSNGTGPDGTVPVVIQGNYTHSSGTLSATNVVISSGASFALSGGTVSLTGNWTNEGTFTHTGGTVSFDGTAAQTITGTNNFFGLAIDNSAGVTIDGNTTVQEMLSLNAGTLTTNDMLTLLSNSASTAMVVNNGGSISGNTTVQRYTIDNSAQPWASYGGVGYHYFSSPVSGATVADFAGHSLEVSQGLLFNDNWNQPITPFPNFFQYDEGRMGAESFAKGWYVPGEADALEAGRGFIANLANNVTTSISGALNNGDVAVTGITRGTATDAGWHLLGNPYPAPINGQAFLADNADLDASLYVRIATGQYAGIFASYSAGCDCSSTPDLTWDGNISSMQGFFVRKSVVGGSASATFKNSHRLTSYESPNFYRKQSNLAGLMRLRITQAGNGRKDDAVVYFSENATAGLDQAFDAYKVQYNPSGFPTLFTEADGQMLSINAQSVSALTAEWSMPLQLWVETAGEQVLSLKSWEHFPIDLQLFVEDKETGAFWELAEDYPFQASKGMLKDRLVLHLKPAQVTGLPESLAQHTKIWQAGQQLVVQSNEQFKGASLLDLSGRTMAQWADATAMKLPSGLAQGVYIVRLHHADGIYSQRVAIW